MSEKYTMTGDRLKQELYYYVRAVEDEINSIRNSLFTLNDELETRKTIDIFFNVRTVLRDWAGTLEGKVDAIEVQKH